MILHLYDHKLQSTYYQNRYIYLIMVRLRLVLTAVMCEGFCFHGYAASRVNWQSWPANAGNTLTYIACTVKFSKCHFFKFSNFHTTKNLHLANNYNVANKKRYTYTCCIRMLYCMYTVSEITCFLRQNIICLSIITTVESYTLYLIFCETYNFARVTIA